MAWNIGLSAWIIQDRNYPDFSGGQTAEFAVEFFKFHGSTTEVSGSEISVVVQFDFDGPR